MSGGVREPARPGPDGHRGPERVGRLLVLAPDQGELGEVDVGRDRGRVGLDRQEIAILGLLRVPAPERPVAELDQLLRSGRARPRRPGCRPQPIVGESREHQAAWAARGRDPVHEVPGQARLGAVRDRGEAPVRSRAREERRRIAIAAADPVSIKDARVVIDDVPGAREGSRAMVMSLGHHRHRAGCPAAAAMTAPAMLEADDIQGDRQRLGRGGDREGEREDEAERDAEARHGPDLLPVLDRVTCCGYYPGDRK